MYLMKSENLCYEKIWVGRELESFRDNLLEGNIGEIWNIACHQNGTGIVANRKFKEIRFNELIKGE